MACRWITAGTVIILGLILSLFAFSTAFSLPHARFSLASLSLLLLCGSVSVSIYCLVLLQSDYNRLLSYTAMRSASCALWCV